MQKDFFILLKKLKISSPNQDFLQQNIDVQDLKWDSQTKQGKIWLKPKKLIPLNLLKELEEKIIKTGLNLEIVWQKQFNWYLQENIVKDYIYDFFFQNLQLQKSELINWKIEIDQLKKNLTIFLPSKKLLNSDIKEKIVSFLNERSVAIDLSNLRIIFLKTVNQKKEEEDLQSIFKKNQEEVKSSFLDTQKAEGKILKVEETINSNRHLFKILLETKNNSSQIIYFYKNNNLYDTDLLKVKNWIRFYKSKQSTKKEYFTAEKFETIPVLLSRYDKSASKRTELHIHTKMSALDGIGDIYDYLEYAYHWGHKAIAFTDHQNVHAFPDCEKISKKFPDIKTIFGCEFEFLNGEIKVIDQKIDRRLEEQVFVFLDIETTGLSVFFDDIIEFAAVTFKNGLVLNKSTFFIQTEQNISKEIQEFTGIDLKIYQKKALPLEKAAKKIKKLLTNHIIVAHNASFDISFLQKLFQKTNILPITNPVIDNLALSRFLNKELSYHRLEKLAKFYKVFYSKEKAHRALYDAEVLKNVFNQTLYRFQITNLLQIWEMNDSKIIYSKMFPKHLIVLVKNQTGLKSLYKLISLTHTETLFKKPTLLRKDLIKYRNNFLVGACCYNSEVFNAAIYDNDEVLEFKISFYDYIEIQPLEVYQHLVERKKLTSEQLKKVVWRIIKFAKKLSKTLVATGDVHYLEPEHHFYRDVFVFNKQLGGTYHNLFDFNNKLKRTPPQYFRTTEEMLAAFQFLEDEKLIQEMVIDNTNKIADQIEQVSCFDNKFIMPKIADDKKILKDVAQKKLKAKYGKNPESLVEERFQKELNLVLQAGYATIYLISYYVTDYSFKKGYFFGSRGSVGSSFLAFCLNITEVNPLSPHYLCSKCFYFQWGDKTVYLSGFDLVDKVCPKCSKKLKKDGHEINFETFLGLKSENIPDIDLNFSSEFQENAQKYIVQLLREKLGEKRIFWTGTVNTVAAKSAYGYYKTYLEYQNNQSEQEENYADVQRTLYYCSGVKKTTGQHPGGLILIPNEKDVLDFTPYNFPSNNKESNSLTTHFDYHILQNKLLKIDILGHDDPKGLRMLSRMTGVTLKSIDLGDKTIIKLFTDITVLNLHSQLIKTKPKTGTLGLPEFGTHFVMQILKEVKVTTFSNLIAISGLAHGKNVWESNAKNLLKTNPDFTLNDVISCRDDIFLFLTEKGVAKKFSYQIMQKVKKGKILSNSELRTLEKFNIPDWYIDSCKKIKYLFPKAHAAAYVIMACRFAYFKIYHPYEFYAVYFSIRCDVFDLKTILDGKAKILVKKQYIQEKLKTQFSFSKEKKIPVSTKEKKLLPIYEIALEMLDRDVVMTNIDLILSEAETFQVHTIDGQKQIIPPFIAINGLGIEIANKIVLERSETPFLSQEDFFNRTKVNQTVFATLKSLQCFAKLAKKNVKTFDFY